MASTGQSSSNKRPKVSDVDRLSSLPDAVICHILSYLPTILSVSTCILAKRWRNLWAHVPAFDFSNEFRNPFSSTSFSSIINRVMLHHRAQTIDTFRLHYDRFTCSVYEVDTWIIFAIMRGVRNLEIFVDLQILLPPCIFTCKTLVELTLHNCKGIPFGGASVTLHLLKILQLCFVEYLAQEALTHLLSGCPVLEELTIEGVHDRDFDCFEIDSPTIRSLVLDISAGLFPRVDINAPALRYLKIEQNFSYECVSISPATSLIEADVWLNNYHEVEVYDEFINNLCNVQSLTLAAPDDECYPEIEEAVGSLVRFGNLRRLELDADFCFLIRLLNNADNIEVLVIHELHMNLRTSEHSEQVPKCLSSNLKSIIIDGFGSTEWELTLVEYLLKHSLLLQTMDINSREDENDFLEKFDALKKMASFDRGSEACELVFNEVSLGFNNSWFCRCSKRYDRLVPFATVTVFLATWFIYS